MTRAHEVRDWYRFLGAATASDGAMEILCQLNRLEDAYDLVNRVLKLLVGSPGGECEEILIVVRSGLAEAIDELTETMRLLQYDGPGAA